jgi:nucleoside-diphosphate-sugar epimerase
MGERVLVTGATGFIGSHLVEELIRLGYEVDVLVRESSDLRWLSDKKTGCVYGDLAGTSPLPTLEGINYIFHLGGATRALRPGDFFRINRQGTEALLAAARNIEGLKGFIFLSSQAAAGPSPDGRSSTETDLPGPVSPYGESKLQAEGAVLNCRDRFHVTILRPCGVYGPRDTYMLELFKQISRGFIPSVGKGPMYLNFCYVDDMVQALILSMKQDRPSGEIFFIADGEKYSLDYFADVVSTALHIKPRKIVIPTWAARCYAAAADVWGLARGKPAAFSRNKCAEACCRNWVCDVGKAKKELGFRPGFLLESGVNITLKWYKEQGWL